ncbi:MAG: protein-L-isoaspartate O-methyltransferase [Candidatus Hodarchaeales archaeon]|jgi:protein-L-isoaspartate(D-aspartate) O-methyltransferase
MIGWIIPPPKPSRKSKKIFLQERQRKVAALKKDGFLKSKAIEEAMLKIPREKFVPFSYRDHSYKELPFPLPGKNSTISCPHSYPMFYEAIELSLGDNFLEIGIGSGYGAVLAAEIVGPDGQVTSIEIDHDTFIYAKKRISLLGHSNLFLVEGDGGKGYLNHAPYDKICVTAACVKIPPPLVNQLKEGGKLITPCGIPNKAQDLILLEKNVGGDITIKGIEKVLYVSLQGEYGR